MKEVAPSSSEPSQAPPFVDQPLPHPSLLQERQLSHYFHSITPCHSGGTTSSLFFNRFCHIEDNVQLGWGESWGRKFLLLMLSYFGNLVIFCLILKFLKFFILVSMVIKEKFSKWNERNWIFFFTWLRFCIMLTKVDELLKLLLNSTLVLPL